MLRPRRSKGGSKRLRLRRKDIYVDFYQGINRDGQAFGYVGAPEKDVQGWFFDYPDERAGVHSVADIENCISTLNPDESVGCALNGSIPKLWAEQVLRRELNVQRRNLRVPA